MAKNELTFEDLHGALIMISYDAVSTEDDDQAWSYCLPYTFDNGSLIRYELDGEDDVDYTIDLNNYAVAQTTQYDLDKFKTVSDLLVKILLTEGKEIIREAPFNEEEVVDNRVTLTLYDKTRNEILSRSRKIGSSAPKKAPVPESTPVYTPEQLSDLGKSLRTVQRSICIEGWKDLGFHTLLLVAAGALALWIFWDYQISNAAKWVYSVMFGLYFTQIWWSNRRTCPIFVAWPLERRAEGRPWINGGMLSGVGMGILLFCIPGVALADAFLAGLIIAYCVTACWCVFAWLNDLISGGDNMLSPVLKSMERRSRRAARRSFFYYMFGF